MKNPRCRKLRLGVVGAGRIFDYQSSALKRLGDIDAVCICDVAGERLAAYGDMPAYQHLDDMLKHEICDAMLVSVPLADHLPVARQLLESGVGVILEKPAAASLDQFDALIRLAGKKGLFFYVCIHAAFAMDVLWFLEQYHERLQKRWGRAVAVEGHFYDPYIVDGKTVPRALSLVGAWVDSGINSLSVAKYFIDWRAMQVEQAAFTRMDTPAPTEIQAGVRYRFPLAGRAGSGILSVDTNWTLNLDCKMTKIDFEDPGTQVLLDHSRQRVVRLKHHRFEACLADFSQSGQRLTNHYINLFSDCLDHYQRGAHNLDEAYHLHRQLFAPYDLTNGLPAFYPEA